MPDLNHEQMPQEILFSLSQLLDEIQNTKKMKTGESKKRKFEKKVRNRMSCFNIYTYIF